jgi:hypothetical protein
MDFLHSISVSDPSCFNLPLLSLEIPERGLERKTQEQMQTNSVSKVVLERELKRGSAKLKEKC